MTEPVLPTALAWRRRGHGVFPLHWPVTANGQTVCSCGRLCGKRAAKHPYEVRGFAPHGLLDATLNRGLIERWFGLCIPDANLGVATERLVVIDIDPRDSGDESLQALEREHGELPLTWRTLTGGGGEHIIYAAPDGVEIGQRRRQADDGSGARSRHRCSRPRRLHRQRTIEAHLRRHLLLER